MDSRAIRRSISGPAEAAIRSFSASRRTATKHLFYRHPGRSEAESRDPGATTLRRPLGPG
ncbi:hypothetical protein CSW59_11165 [Caulobacter sp. BP25]|nr:hypothetical protein CSW59_11165 [Caulobacter sp. BP25]